MKPLKLKMQAFGPYAGVESIDFTALENRTMFVISGKTGAGKTTIFDAISYAIYGKASGEDRNGPELRSQFSSDDLETEVSLEFSLRDKMYHIIRSPQQERQKKSGEGVRLIGAKAELYTWDESGEKKLLAAKVNEVEEKIKEIMLIDSNQFRQILMIPQGEFRKLLTSDSKDKELILQRLFHTQFYKSIEEKLKQEASELKATVETQVNARGEAIRRIQVFENDDLKSYIDAGSTNDTLILPLLHEEINSMGAVLEKLTQEADKKKSEREELLKKHVEAKAIVNQFVQLNDLKQKKESLEGRREEFLTKEQSVALAQKANLLAKQEELCHRLKQDVEEARTKQESYIKQVDIFAAKLVENERDLEHETAKEPERKAADDECYRLQMIKDDVYSYAEMNKKAETLKNGLAVKKKEKSVAEESLRSLETQLQELQLQKSEIEKAQLTFSENGRLLDKLKNGLDQVAKFERTFTRLNQLSKELEVKKGVFEKETARFDDARAYLEEIEFQWMSGQAAILASTLRSDEACPVCGSEHHPMPAHRESSEIPNEKDLKAAKSQAAKVEQEKTAAQMALFECQSQKNSAENEVQSLLDEIKLEHPNATKENYKDIKDDLSFQFTNLTQAQLKLSSLLKNLGAVNEAIESGVSKQESFGQNINQLTELINDMTVKYTQHETNLKRMTEQIPETLRSISGFEKAVEVAKALQQSLKRKLEQAQQTFLKTKENHGTEMARLEETVNLLNNRQSTLVKEREVFRGSMEAQGFETYRAYEEAKRTEAEIVRMESEIRSYREQFRSISDQFTQLNDLLTGVTAPDLEAMEMILAKLGEEVRALDERQRDLYLKKRDNVEIAEKIERLNKDMKTLEE
ncbi:MAG: AAA family ATPase, partial [Bacillota bacterium]|nr:AAA family ATPase [Bacillota bacterium]